MHVVSTSEEEAELPINNVNLEIEGNKVDEQRVGGDELLRASFQYQASREGLFTGRIQLENDGLGVDNVRYFTFSVENKPELLSGWGNHKGHHQKYILPGSCD